MEPWIPRQTRATTTMTTAAAAAAAAAATAAAFLYNARACFGGVIRARSVHIPQLTLSSRPSSSTGRSATPTNFPPPDYKPYLAVNKESVAPLWGVTRIIYSRHGDRRMLVSDSETERRRGKRGGEGVGERRKRATAALDARGVISPR